MGYVWYGSVACLWGHCLVAASLAGELASEPHSEELWRLVAESRLIVVGVPRVPVEAVRASVASQEPQYLAVPVACEETLQGSSQTSVEVQFYAAQRQSPSVERLLAMDGRRAVFFLVKPSDTRGAGFYFAGHSSQVLSEAGGPLVAEIRAEVQRQRELLEKFPKLFSARDEPLYGKVKGLIDATTRKDIEQNAFRELEALGPSAVPAIILLMDDRRELPEKAIALKNPEGHWEGVRHYGPKTVTDALAAILNQITGESFGSIYNGGTELERREVVNAWRIYLCHLAKKSEARRGHD